MTGPLGSLRRKWASARGYTVAEKLLVLPSLMMLGLSRLAILALPFRWYVRVLGRVATQGEQAPPLSTEHNKAARSIGRSVRATAALTPWESVCLPQAMTASVLLKLRGIPHCVHFGLAPGEKAPEAAPMQAHAWIVAGERIVTGAPVLPEYRIVATFITLPQP